MLTNIKSIGSKIANREQILNYLQQCGQNRKSRVVALYNSDLDMLIEGKDQDLMVFPIDDRLANRAHGVMETGNIKNYRISGLNNHLDRLFNSAAILGIQVPLPKETIESKIHDMAHLAYSILQNENYPDLKDQVLVLKIWVSSGIGDFDIYSCNKKPILYAALYIAAKTESNEENGVKEYIHPEMWTKPHYFSNAKTVNYLELATMADYSKIRGGYFGIKTDSKGILLEGAISNIAFLLKDGRFGHPPLARTIRGTTLTKAVKIVAEQLQLKSQEIELNLTELNLIQELFHLSNDHVIPILSVNDQIIGDGCVGKLCSLLQNQLEISRGNVNLQQGDLVRGLQLQEIN